ncbi:MAG: ferritin-like domain-containing protein [Chloroflexi bacterium]|nr:ferritin-like domain-containing protein [Chloroflexota bacterium]
MRAAVAQSTGAPGLFPSRTITRVLPDLEDDLLLELFHKGARTQWTSRDLDWTPSLRLNDRQREALARLLTPVYFGEQTAMAGASGILPQLMQAGETSAQLYLSSFIMDEARHFEALTRLYGTLGFDPLGVRQVPELLRYYHRLRQGDRLDWAWGILFSDLNAKRFYRALSLRHADPLFGDLAARIVRDESRHLAFAEHYLRRNLARTDAARRRSLLAMRDELFRTLQAMTERVRADAVALEVDADDYLAGVWADVEASAERIGLVASTGSADGTVGPHAPSRTPEPLPEPPAMPERSAEARATISVSLPECFGCLLTLMCGRQLALT